jgi:hypothetical protein
MSLSRFTWKEYQSLLEKLSSDISKYLKKNNLEVDTVVPIMRGGGVPGIYLAYALHVLSILPVHYHYDFREKGKMKLRRFISIKKYIDLIPKNPVILLVEGNQCFGNTANAAVKDIKVNIKNPVIIYATDLVDFGHRNAVKADAVFFGKYTNECETLSEKEARAKDIFPSAKLLPWEVEKEEKETIKTKQFDYRDLNQYFTKSTVVKEIKLNDSSDQ